MRILPIVTVILLSSAPTAGAQDVIADTLLFHASFDESADADFAQGDPKIYTASSLERDNAQHGLHADGVRLDKRSGRYGGSLYFGKKSETTVFFRGGKNVPYSNTDFQGTISFWMRVNPDDDLPPGYVDPLQITDKTWNNASLFVDFTKELPRQFRLGVFSDYDFWNPRDRAWDNIPESERPMVSVTNPRFSRQEWTHVAITFEGFNSQADEGRATLFLQGKPQGALRGKQRFTWNPAELAIMLGIYYVGAMDDLAIFRRALSESEIARLMELPDGIKSLR